MAVEPVTDPNWITRIKILANVSGGAFRNPISWGFWALDKVNTNLSDFVTAWNPIVDPLIGASASAGLRSLLPDETTIIGAEYSRPLVDPQPVPQQTVLSRPGTAGGLVTPEAALVFSFKSGTAGPAFRGRTYVGGIRTTLIDQTTALFVPGNLATALTAWEDFRVAAKAVSATSFMAVVSRFETSNGITIPRVSPLVDEVLQITADLHVDTQRRRGVR